MARRPNVLLILNDDMGYSDLGCYGGEVLTPHLDALAAGGLRFTGFCNTARCCPSRASLLTGLHPHQTGVGWMTEDDGLEGYRGTLNERCVTIAEVLGPAGYRTSMAGKWHVCGEIRQATSAWPHQRGFEQFWGTIQGAGSYYAPGTLTCQNENVESEAYDDPDFCYTDAIADHAAGYLRDHVRRHPGEPFFCYTAFTAPHWPLHAPEADIERYAHRFDAGWDVLRAERLERMIALGLLPEGTGLSPRDPAVPAWRDASDREWEARRMAVYAAQIDRMDQGIGRIVAALRETGQLDDTLILFLADNGGCAEVLTPRSEEWLVKHRVGQAFTRVGSPVRYGNDPTLAPGGEDTYQSYGVGWANLSNTPFRLYKHWIHEGGIATPLIAHWPAGLAAHGELRHDPGQLPDLMATILDLTGAAWPETRGGQPLPPPAGTSLAPAFRGEAVPRESPLCWEHEGHAGVRDGRWKLVRRHPGDWELYDLADDRSELADLADSQPARAAALLAQYQAWAARCCVVDRDELLAHRRRLREGR